MAGGGERGFHVESGMGNGMKPGETMYRQKQKPGRLKRRVLGIFCTLGDTGMLFVSWDRIFVQV